MKRVFTLFLTLISGTVLPAQDIDTLTIASSYFDSERTVYVYKPAFYRYQSELVKLPVIYLLDAQHEWFVEPVLNTIEYLQYTHEIPQTIVVTIPLENRIKECEIQSIKGEALPLHRFITEELAPAVNTYGTNGYHVMTGHSFSASFALYSLLRAPEFYAATLAHSPFDELELLVSQAMKGGIDLNKIYQSVGGPHQSKDKYHREKFEELKEKYPSFFDSIHTYEGNSSAHNAVPIVSTPQFLSDLFETYSYRFSHIAAVDMNYELVEEPVAIDSVLNEIDRVSRQSGFEILPEIPEINGMASRFMANGYNHYGISIYEQALTWYPEYFEFHWYLAELYIELQQYLSAAEHLELAFNLLQTHEQDLAEKDNYLDALNELKLRLPKSD